MQRLIYVISEGRMLFTSCRGGERGWNSHIGFPENFPTRWFGLSLPPTALDPRLCLWPPPSGSTLTFAQCSGSISLIFPQSIWKNWILHTMAVTEPDYVEIWAPPRDSYLLCTSLVCFLSLRHWLLQSSIMSLSKRSLCSHQSLDLFEIPAPPSLKLKAGVNLITSH